MTARRIFSLGLAWLATVGAGRAQPPQAAGDAATPTLHVYTNLAQIPTLILSSSHDRAQVFDSSKLRVSLDGGPPFQPTHVRAEGDDPIALAILIDVTRPDNQLLGAFESAIAGVALGYLERHDRVSVYAMGCTLIRATYSLPADSAKLERAVDQALAPTLYGTVSTPCQPTMPLWDSLERVTRDLAEQPGRRVLLAVTSGEDTGSVAAWSQVGDLTMQHSVAVFGVMPPGMEEAQWAMLHQTFGSPFPGAKKRHEDPFKEICELSGGVELTAGAKTLAAQLGRAVQMVRERYIIEFPRSNEGAAGRHLLAVSLPGSDDYIRPSGISIPRMDRKVPADPNTLPSNAAAPEFGKRRPLPAPPPN